ncbi:hypothetical protein AV530_019632 [Patagioenas fasciata monilis]|uniref:Uncharacterized protein n=1 Tax=Patagioenas fasciata monilis TaxID=372326 RepID=A0A1V4JEP5_PATFA|nr:hypothetical protein AV530_019632 [Patagioenas fasciata monilis]
MVTISFMILVQWLQQFSARSYRSVSGVAELSSIFDSKSHCLQLRHFVPPNKPVSNNSLTALIPTAIRTEQQPEIEESEDRRFLQDDGEACGI